MKRGREVWKKNWFYLPVIVLAAAAVILGDRTVTVISESIVPDRGACIILDAGHGGEDGGTTSFSGVTESGINLEIALRLNDLFHLLGYETKMIRTTDVSVHTEGNTIAARKRSDLNNRVRMIRETEDALLLSIHQNYYPDGRYSGAQVFYADTEGSQALAEALQTAFAASVNPGSRRKSKAADGIFLMEHIGCTGVLVECGFLSSPEEDVLLQSKDYQQKLCCVIASTVSVYLSNT